MSANAILIDWDENPIPTIEKARNNEHWFEAVVFSAMMLERFGYFKIKEHLASLKANPFSQEETKKTNPEEGKIGKDLKQLHLPQIVLFLLGIGKISVNECKAILQINTERNHFVHRKIKKFVHGKNAETKYKPLVNQAIGILRDRLNAEQE